MSTAGRWHGYAEWGRFLCPKLTVVRDLTETLAVRLRKLGSGDKSGNHATGSHLSVFLAC